MDKEQQLMESLGSAMKERNIDNIIASVKSIARLDKEGRSKFAFLLSKKDAKTTAIWKEVMGFIQTRINEEVDEISMNKKIGELLDKFNQVVIN